MVDRTKLANAVQEARRFIERAKQLPEPQPVQAGDYQYLMDSYPKETGAIRRASMDLTRSLAELRKRDNV